MKITRKRKTRREKIILCVDDDRMMRAILYDIFNRNGIKVVLGINGRDGLREFKESNPDIVITDCRMETATAGIKLARKIKKVSRDTPVILISGEESFGQMPKEGPDVILKKPCGIYKIVKIVFSLLNRTK